MSKKKQSKISTAPNSFNRGHMPRGHAEGGKQQIIVPQRLLEERRAEDNHLLNALVVAASKPETEVDKMERLWIMHKEAMALRAEHEFAIAKNSLSKVIPPIPKNSKISFIDKKGNLQESKYANREDIEGVLAPLYQEAGFSLEYTTDYIDGKIMTSLIVRHNSGHKEVYRAPPMPLDTSGSKNNNQAAGSTAEYGKRYALIGAFNVVAVDNDDDGNNGDTLPDKSRDKFAERVSEAAPDQTEDSLSLAADTLSGKLLTATTIEKRGEIFMKNMKIISALEAGSEAHKLLAINIRKLAEEAPNAQ